MITRRRFLQGGGGAVASLLLPSSMMGIATNAYAGSPPLLKSETVDSKFFGNDIITKTWGYDTGSHHSCTPRRKGASAI